MKKIKGFTLIELLIVVAIIGIIAAIAIPNLLDAIERSRQKRSTAEIKTMALALQSFSVDYGGYPDTADVGDGPIVPETWVAYTEQPTGSPAFVPDYLQAVPRGDGWNVAYQYHSSMPSDQIPPRLGRTVDANFILFSLGSDRADAAPTDPDGNVGASEYVTWVDANLTGNVPGTLQTWCYEADIVWINSAFQQAPEGKQKKC